MPEVRLHACDAAEFAEVLQYLAGWLGREGVRPLDTEMSADLGLYRDQRTCALRRDGRI